LQHLSERGDVLGRGWFGCCFRSGWGRDFFEDAGSLHIFAQLDRGLAPAHFLHAAHDRVAHFAVADEIIAIVGFKLPQAQF
jgi:hypothetical protein